MPTCPNCERDSPDGFLFCPYCATPFHPAHGATATERKVVTVLFCDLVGFTARSDQADPEDVQARIGPYHARLRTEVERFGGTVEKFIGDAVMAVFGAPLAHEDDAERAVRSGLRIIEAISDLNEKTPHLGLQVRVGINTGEAVVSMGARPERGEGIVTGDVVNTASRLQTIAPVGGIVVSRQTFRATERIFEYERLDPVTVKGKAEPIPIWRAISARSRFGTDLTRAHPTPLVGRQIDLGMLTGAFEKAVQESTVHLVTVSGEPGVGKSRLVSELFRYVDAKPDLTRWRQGRCLPYGEGITFWALGEIVKAEAGILETDSPQAAGTKLERVLPEGPEREWFRQRLNPLLGLQVTSTAELEELFTAWRRFLEVLSASAPSVFVFEDLHWADEAMLAFVEHVAEWSEAVPMLLVGTARPELHERQPAWGGGKRNATTINLSPLTDRETAELVSNLLEQGILPWGVQSLVLERSGGNPLYAEEFVRLLRDRKVVVNDGRTLGLADRAEIPLPESVQGLIAARLDTLSPERKTLIQDAAVVGKVFWAGALAAMSGRDPNEVTEALHELSRRELVRPVRSSSMEGEAEYAFLHILVRDVAYAQIPRAERAERHRRAATWIESVSGERVEDHAEILAHHYTQALDLATAAGQADQARELEAPARRFLILSGDRALGLEVAKAEANYRRALDLVAEGHPERDAILYRWGDALSQSGRHAEAARSLEEAIAGFRSRGQRSEVARALITLGRVRRAMADPIQQSHIQEAVALLEEEPPGPDLVRAYAEMSGAEAILGDYVQAIAFAERAMSLASRLGLPEPPRALGIRGYARLSLGDPEGLTDQRAALRIALQRGLGMEAARLYNNLALGLWPIEGPAAALEANREGMAFAEARGVAELAQNMATQSLVLLYQMGSLDAAMAEAEAVAERAEEGGQVDSLLEVRPVQVLIHLRRGQALQAAPLADWAVETARRMGSAEPLTMALSGAASVQQALGKREDALALLAEFEVAPNLKENPQYPTNLPEMARAAAGSGEPGLAERLARGLNATYPMHRHALLTAGAIVAEAMGETKDAARLYAEAASAWKAFGNVVERAFALTGQGRCLLAIGKPAEATKPLRQARDLWAAMRAKPHIEETDVLLERATS